MESDRPTAQKETVNETLKTSKKKTKKKNQKKRKPDSTDDSNYQFSYIEDGDLNFKHICPYNIINEYQSNVTKLYDINHIPNKLYAINEDLYQDIEMMMSDDEIQDYRLYKVMRTEQTTNVHDDALSLRDLTEPLSVTEEVTNLGLILNFNVYLSFEQWHTIRKLDKGVYSCTVCELRCGGMTVADHLRCGSHVRALAAHPPLKRFDLSITRKINQNFHCGVCNVIYPIINHREHENSKDHEGNLLFAINKVSDITWSSGNSGNKNTQAFDTNNIQEPNNAPSGANINYPSHTSNLNTATFPSNNASLVEFTLDNAMQSYINTIDANVWTDKNSNFADRTLSDTSSNNMSGDHVEYKPPRLEHGFNFGKSYKDIKIYEEEEMEEYIPPIEGVSYACMASKPRLQVPKFLKIDLGTKEVRVKFESWNMITQTDLNQFYCMVCTKSFLVRYKIQHCLQEEHKKILAKCSVVGAFEDYLIRDVSDKLYHCGHCNNLQYKNDMQIHVEKYHPLKNAKPIDMDRVITQAKRNEPTSKPKIDINASFKFSPFGTEIIVSNMSCHTLMLVKDKYNCALCDVYIQGELLEHVYEALHMKLINMTPFIKPFLNNLTRAVRGSLHCAICNILINVSSIKDHNISPAHTNRLADALGMVRNERPKQEIKYQCEERTEFKNDAERFLATLPPNSRGALSKMKIKNHKGELFNLSDAASSSSSSCSSDTPISTSLTNSPSHVQEEKISAERENLLREAERLREIDNATNRKIRARTQSVNSNASNKVNQGRKDGGNTVCNETNIRTRSDSSSSFGYYLQDTDNVTELDNIKKEIDSCVQETVDYRYICNPSENYYPKRNRIHRDSDNQRDTSCYNTIKMSKANHNNNEYATNFNNMPVLPGQILTVSMIENNLQPTTVSPLTLKVTGPINITPTGDSCIPVTPVKKSDIDSEQNVKNAAQKKKDVKKSARVDSDEEEVRLFKFDETVLLKLKSNYFKITYTSYNTLLHRSNGSRYCFVCSISVDIDDLQRHVDSTEHIKNIAKNKFLYNFCGPLFRQMYLMYHCAVCNVTMTRKEVKIHLEWTTHVDKYEYSSKKLSKKYLKEALRCGAKEYAVETQKELLYVNIPEPCVSVVTYVQSATEDFEDTFVETKLIRKSQMIILRGNMMKICFESWHGILVTKNGVKCIICQLELREDAVMEHVESQYHGVALGITFEKHYYPALIRKINENTVNCVICNLELPNDDSLVFEHIQGRKHDKNYNTIVKRTSRADSYSDCYSCPITL